MCREFKPIGHNGVLCNLEKYLFDYPYVLNNCVYPNSLKHIGINTTFSKHRPSALMLSISRNVRLSVCTCVRLSVCVSVHF